MFSDFPTQESFFSLGTNICLYRMDLLLDSGHKELLLTEGLPTLWWIKAWSCVLYTITWQITSSADKDSCAGIKRKPIHTKQKILEIGYKSKTYIWKNTDKFKETARVSEKYRYEPGGAVEGHLYWPSSDERRGVTYSMDSTHYSDVYGLFVSKSASCAGATRARALPESTWNPVHSCKWGGIQPPVVQSGCKCHLLDLWCLWDVCWTWT